MFVRPTAAAAGNIFEIRDNDGPLLTLALDPSGKLTLESAPFGLDLAAQSALTLDEFHHVMLRLSGGTACVYADGELAFSGEMTPSVTLEATEARLGGFTGQIDEFLFKHGAGTGAPVIPSQPYRGVLKAADVGGAGDGSFGNVTIDTADVQINTYAMVTAMADARTLALGSRNHGIYGAFDVGNEVMVHASLKRGSAEAGLGRYSLRRIAASSGNTVTLDRPVDEFALNSGFLADYRVQILSVPNYGNLTVTASGVVIPGAWNETSGGGIVAFKCRGTLTIDGWIRTGGYGPAASPPAGFAHSQAIDNFILSYGGGAFIVARTITGAETGRIGNSVDGNTKGGTPGQDSQRSDLHSGADGGVGRGGRGGRGHTSVGDRLGGDGGIGGSGGKGGSASGSSDAGSGGGGMGGKGGRHSGPGFGEESPGSAEGGGDGYGAPVAILIAKFLKLPPSVISTGGGGGGGGGGGNNGGVDKKNANGGPGSSGNGGEDGMAGSLTYGTGGGDGGAGYGGGGGGGGDGWGNYGGGGGGGSGTGFAYIAAEVLLAA
jgi:hypothetical protein